MEELLKQKGFSRILFDTIPQLALVLDPMWRVHALNQAARALGECAVRKIQGERCGDVIGCVHHQDDPRGCGFGPSCITCIAKNIALEAIEGMEARHAKGKLEFQTGRVMPVLASASPFEYKHQKYAVIIIEDISLITELQGLIPICASCKKIRDDNGYWNRVENYIEEHSEAEFTHDICPECSKELYSKMQERSNNRNKKMSI
ncbi:hypothetical protein [Desulfosporosinus metallidurans]|uniref:PAS domain-containing protein n=1 Tax=Desulfosporosinus metallidurans TaxID=1888891 RepID=A0A1Q8QUG8_9FIRM|nr:hypothetical protein [Desulfosporosinus metallidurans]OLN30976.1 hypothetical protein DSOL_2863 [Desulfosporosinus metallidurans]